MACFRLLHDDDDDGWLRRTVGRTPVFGRRTDPVLQLTGDHYVGKPSAAGQPTRPTQPFILPGSINAQ